MKTVFCISGLGADERAFSKLKLPGYNLKVIQWKIPLPAETLQAYATRMLQEINEDNPVLIGLSFGGMVSIEIAKQIPVQKIILISSIKTKDELPAWMRLVARSKLNKFFPMRSFKVTEPVQNYFLGVKSKEEKDVVAVSRRKANTAYTNWAVNQVVNWKNTWQHPRMYHIHGSSDRMFPIKNIKADAVIKNGSHFMIMNRAGEVSELLLHFLNK